MAGQQNKILFFKLNCFLIKNNFCFICFRVLESYFSIFGQQRIADTQRVWNFGINKIHIFIFLVSELIEFLTLMLLRAFQ
jgi:hypothetical protein